MSAISDILKTIPIGDLADEVGASKQETKTAASQVIQALLGGMSANVADGGGEDLTAALQEHAPSTRKTTKTTGGTTPKTTKPAAGTTPKTTTRKTTKPNVAEVDQSDGAKIIQHILGTSPDDAAAAVADKTGSDPSLLSKLMPILAPIVMAYLANKMFKGSATGSAAGAGLGGLLGGLLFGQQRQQQQQQQDGNLIGDILGGMLGQSMGSGKSAASGGLGNLLGNLF